MDELAEKPSLKATAAYWDANAEMHFAEGVNHNRAEGQAHPLVQARAARLLGQPSVGDWLRARMPAVAGRALGVGVGAAGFELELLASGCVEEFDLYDVSAVSLEPAAVQARALGVEEQAHLFCEDVMAAELPVAYDLVTFRGSLHHATDLDLMVDRVRRAMLPGALLFGDEYVGPNRFAYPPEHSVLAKTWFRTLAPELLCPWPELPQPDPSEVAKADPTEAVHSERILDVLAARFEYLEITPLYGALPFILWWGLQHDALYDLPAGRDLVEVLLEVDEALGRSGRLPTYFAAFVAQR